MDAKKEGIERRADDGERIVWTHGSDLGELMLTAIPDADGAGAAGYRVRADRKGERAVSADLTAEAALGLAAAIIYDDDQQHEVETGRPTLSRDAHDLLRAIATGPGGVDPRIGPSRLHHERFSRPVEAPHGGVVDVDAPEASQ